MTGTGPRRLMRSIRPLPPRGMITSTYSRHGDQVAHRGAIGGFHQLHGVGRQAGVHERGLHLAPQRQVGLQRLGAAAQDAGVAALDGQRGGFDRDVGPALVDHAEHAQRHAHLPHADAAGPALHAADLAHRVGHGGDLLAALGHGVDDLRRERQAVEQRAGQAGGTRGSPGPARWRPAGRRCVRAAAPPAFAALHPWPPWRPPPWPCAAARAAAPRCAM